MIGKTTRELNRKIGAMMSCPCFSAISHIVRGAPRRMRYHLNGRKGRGIAGTSVEDNQNNSDVAFSTTEDRRWGVITVVRWTISPRNLDG